MFKFLSDTHTLYNVVFRFHGNPNDYIENYLFRGSDLGESETFVTHAFNLFSQYTQLTEMKYAFIQQKRRDIWGTYWQRVYEWGDVPMAVPRSHGMFAKYLRKTGTTVFYAFRSLGESNEDFSKRIEKEIQEMYRR